MHLCTSDRRDAARTYVHARAMHTLERYLGLEPGDGGQALGT